LIVCDYTIDPSQICCNTKIKRSIWSLNQIWWTWMELFWTTYMNSL